VLVTRHHAAKIKGSGTIPMEAKLGAAAQTHQVRPHIMWRGQLREVSTCFGIVILSNLMENSVAKSPTILMPLTQLVLILVSLYHSSLPLNLSLKRAWI
jgi:hypothetical protein